MKKVSIIIPTRNRAHLLERAISHAFAQDYENLEVIVSNNASSDNTETVLKNLLKRFSDLIVVNHDKLLDLNQHWDYVIRNISSGEYIIILSDDDIIVDRSYIKNAVFLFQKYPSIGVVFGNYSTVNQNLKRVNSINAEFEELVPKEFLFANYHSNLYNLEGIGIPLLTAVFEKKAYLKSDGYNLNCMCCDTHLWLKILLSYDAGFIKESVAEYMVHDGNLSRTGKLAETFSDTKIAKDVAKYAQSLDLNALYITKTLDRINRIFYRNFHNKLITNLLNGHISALLYVHKIDWKLLFDLIISKLSKRPYVRD